MSSEIITTPAEKIWLGEDGIIRTQIIQGSNLDFEAAKQGEVAYGKCAGGKKRPLLVDIRVTYTMSREARMHYAGPQTMRHLSAVAVLVNSSMNRIIGNFFLGFNKPINAPLRLFESEAEAIRWLKGFLPE